MLFIPSVFVVGSLVVCFLVSIYSVEQIIVPYVDKVVILYKDMSFDEVDMNGTRYAFADERKIDNDTDEWKRVYIMPVILEQKQNLRRGYECETAHFEFIKQAFARCIGNISDIQSSFENPFDTRLIATFDHWYDNRFTGLIRYLLNKNASANEPAAIYLSIIDDTTRTHVYRFSTFPIIEYLIANEEVKKITPTQIAYATHLRRHI